MNIIDKLRDDNEYYSGEGRKYLSNSDIGALLSNPKEFKKPQEDRKEFMVGRYLHQLILEPEKAKNTIYVDATSRNSKAYKDFLMERDLKVALLKREVDDVHTWYDTIRSNVTMFDLIYDEPNEYELPAVGEIFGEMWKGKADIVGREYIIDLKTSANIKDFRWNARKYNYDSQAFIYQTLFGKPMIFLVIDKNTKMLGMYSVSEDTYNRGKAKVEEAVKVYDKFFSTSSIEDINQFYYDEEI